MHDAWEILFDPPMPRRAVRFMQAMIEAKPAGTQVTEGYMGVNRFLMLYGPGALRRLPIIRGHIRRGGHVAMWDLGYWERETSLRLSIDTLHPTAKQLEKAPAGGRREFELREDANPDGPIILVGLGVKSVAAYGLGAMDWERAKLKDLQRRFPGREIIWRPKGKHPQPLGGFRMDAVRPIAELLRGASMVACRHSNCAIDACVAGVPVECEGGAALALYQDNPNPTRKQRAEFLRKLSYWEWSKDEAPAAWDWLQRITR